MLIQLNKNFELLCDIVICSYQSISIFFFLGGGGGGCSKEPSH